jgi:hypothetical protein
MVQSAYAAGANYDLKIFRAAPLRGL